MRKIIVALLVLNVSATIRYYNKISETADSITKYKKIMYTLNNSVDLVEKCNPDLTPPAIKEAQKNIIGITLEIYPKYTKKIDSLLFSHETIVSRGSGFMIKNRIIVSARHILIDTLSRSNLKITLNNDGIPESPYYDYRFFGTADTADGPVNFDLYLIAIGTLGKHQDYMILKNKDYPPNIKPLGIGPELNEGEIVYNGAYLPILSPYPSEDGSRYLITTSGVIKCNFKGRVVSKFKNMPINRTGTKINYFINMDIEHGYSGGPILNTKGQAVGMSLEMTNNLTVAISIQDIKDAVKELEDRGRIPKN